MGSAVPLYCLVFSSYKSDRDVIFRPLSTGAGASSLFDTISSQVSVRCITLPMNFVERLVTRRRGDRMSDAMKMFALAEKCQDRTHSPRKSMAPRPNNLAL